MFVLLCSWQKRWDHLTFFSHSKIELWWSQKGMTCHHKLALGACLSSTQFSFNVLYVEILKNLLHPVLYIQIFFFKPNKALTCFHEKRISKNVFKGRLISKGFIVFFNFPKKCTKKFCFSRLGQKLTFSSSFFGRIELTEISFEINWPLPITNNHKSCLLICFFI